MGLFDLFKKGTAESGPPDSAPKAPPAEDDALAYSHMRVEVTTIPGQMLFVAKLMYLRGSTAELHQYSETAVPLDSEEPIHVRIRGYQDRQRKAVYMTGYITPKPQHIWQVERLSPPEVRNDRAFFRLETNLDASVVKLRGRNAGERSCKLLNISVGGACVALEEQYEEGDNLLLTVRLLEDRDPSVMYCKILRIIPREDGSYLYGCQFLELNEADQDKIIENIFTAQRKSRAGSN